MTGELSITKQGKIQDPVSPYLPEGEALVLYRQVLKDWQQATLLFNKPRREFNDRSIRREIEVNELAFNSYVPPRSEDPDESWRAQTVRPITRNKLISIAAHVTANVLYPNVFAYDHASNEDKEAAGVMRDMIEWNIENSNYTREFLNAVITALVDPAVIIETGYAKTYRTVKDIQPDGGYVLKEMLDESNSGFFLNVLRANELFCANIYEPDIQKQRFVFKNRFVDYEESKLKWGSKSKNFNEYVRPGVKLVFDQNTNTFYELYDKELQGYLVNEVTYYNKSLDLEVVFINGVLVTEPDAPNPRIDKMYPFVKSGYEPLNNGKFFYYKSAANKLGSDQDIVDTLYNMIIDGTYMALMPPMALYGSEEINSSVMVPGSVSSFRDKDVKFESLAPRIDLRAGLETTSLVERSISESSQDNLRAGVAEGGGRTAREVMLLEKNAQIALGLFGKMIGFMVEDIGKLMISDICQHQTVGEVTEIVGDDISMQFQTFLLGNKEIGGKKVTKKLVFSEDLLGKEEMKESEYLDESMDLLEEMGGEDSEVYIYKINPERFRKLKYKIKVDPDQLTNKSKALEQALKLEAYDRLIQNPYVDQELVTQDFLLGAIKPGDTAKYMKKQQQQMSREGAMSFMDMLKPKGVNQNLSGQITGSNSLGVAMSNV